MKKLALSAFALLVSGAATAQMAAPGSSPVPGTPDANAPAPVQAAPYVAKAGASDLYEIQSSQLAATQAGSSEVKNFAKMMIMHHAMTTKQVTAAARKSGLTPPPPMLEPMQAQMIAQLQPLTGQAFDAAYVAQQKTAHAMALNLHQTYAASGDKQPLRAAATKAVPIVKRHIAKLETM
jgi:putative membrane protein